MNLYYLQDICQDETPCQNVGANASTISVPRWEGPTKNCMNDHFRERYFEIHTAARLPYSKPKIMNYSNMAMLWAKIVLHKDVDWRIVYRTNVNHLSWNIWMIPTNWVGPSGQIGRPTTLIIVLLQSLDHTNAQAMAMITIHIILLATILSKHSVRRMKGEAMGMTTIHTTALTMTFP
jgi:hypothetical protein